MRHNWLRSICLVLALPASVILAGVETESLDTFLLLTPGTIVGAEVDVGIYSPISNKKISITITHGTSQMATIQISALPLCKQLSLLVRCEVTPEGIVIRISQDGVGDD